MRRIGSVVLTLVDTNKPSKVYIEEIGGEGEGYMKGEEGKGEDREEGGEGREGGGGTS